MQSFKNSIFADEDLIQTYIYTIEKWGEEQAFKYKDLLHQGRERICEDPYLPGSRSQEILAKGCRSYRVEHHYFFYRVNEKENTIEIARILHEQRDFPRHVTDQHFPEE